MTLLPQLLTEAAHGGWKPSPTGRLRRVLLHLSYSMALSRLLDTTPPSLLTTAARAGLEPAPDSRLRGTYPHLLHSIAPPFVSAFVAHVVCLSHDQAARSGPHLMPSRLDDLGSRAVEHRHRAV